MASSAQELLRRVLALFADSVENDRQLTALWETVHSGSQDLSYTDAYDFAVRVGEKLSAAYRAVQGDLPERIDAAFADTLLREALRGGYTLVSDAATAVQQALNERAGLGLKAQAAPFDTDRVGRLAEKMARYKKTDDALWLLDEPLKTYSQSVVDDTLKANVAFQGKAGLRPRIVRRLAGGGCEWCRGLAGSYDYPGVPEDVYHRHERCRCTVEYDPGAGKLVQDVWSKRWTRADERDKIEARKQVGVEDFLTMLAKQPSRLVTYTPESLKRALEQQGYKVTPLTQGRLKGVQFENGGGYKVNFTDSGLLMYHPARLSHHDGAYYKISTGKGGTHRYDINGNEKKD